MSPRYRLTSMARILIVDPDGTMARVYASLLIAQGHEPILASGTIDAAAVSEPRSVSLVLTEFCLGESSALELVPILRAKGVWAPVVVMSAIMSVRFAVASVHVGATDCIHKPTDPDDVRQLVDHWVPPHAVAPPHVAQALQLIAHRYQNSELTLQDLARDLALTHEHLCRSLKRYTGKTFREHLTECRAANARLLLSHGHLRVKEVATLCGFSATAGLDRIFRQLYHCTPTAYRRQVLDESAHAVRITSSQNP